MTPAKRKAWHWLRNDMAYKPPEQLGTAEEVALNAFSYGWAKGSADGAAEEREQALSILYETGDVEEAAKHIRARGKA